MIRQCCCNATEPTWATDCPESLPAPLAGCPAPKWRVSAATTGMKGVQYGTGQVLDTSDGGCLDCFKGSCAVTALHEGMVDFADPYAEGDCWTTELLQQACEKFEDGRGTIPTNDGWHVIEWVNNFSLANITYDDQNDCVTILGVQTCRPFGGCIGSTQAGLFSEVTVEFRFAVDINAWSLNPDANGDCVWSQYVITVVQTWGCTYQRRMQVGEYYANGLYRLVRVGAPIGGWLYPGTDPKICTTTSCPPVYFPLEYCAANYDSGINYQGVPFPWTPPGTVSVVRLC